MHFGETLRTSIHPPWASHYIDYTTLKKLLREPEDAGSPTRPPTSPEPEWTEHDESTFVHELINVQLEKVHGFQQDMKKQLHERTQECEERLQRVVDEEEERKPAEERVEGEKTPEETGEGNGEDEGKNGEAEAEGEERTEEGKPPGEAAAGWKEVKKLTKAKSKGKGKAKKGKGKGKAPQQKQQQQKPAEEEKEEVQDKNEIEDVLKQLEGITRDVEELEKFNRINFTGFLKAAKKHDRKNRGKQLGRKGQSPKVKPLLQVRLSQLEFNKEDYSPLLYRLSTMYDFVRQRLGKEDAAPPSAAAKNDGKYTSHKFWVHPDNIIEVKTFLLRRLPVLVYNPVPSKEVESTRPDPTITSLYFDNADFLLYSDKVKKILGAKSVRLRWYGHLADTPEIWLERKTTIGEETQGAAEERISIKKKYVKDFINGDYSMEKTVRKMQERHPDDTAAIEKYQSLVKSIQEFITESDLQPALRASYTRTAFQIPGDSRIRVSLDTDMALIREDALDTERPCRDPEDWHRTDIDDAKMDYPFPALRKGEISRFPYALLELKVREQGLPSRSRAWLEELMSSHLVHPAPRFSKFLHGVAVLFDDYVNTFPFWLSELDKDIRQDPRDAWDAEQERRKQQQLDKTAVGSFRQSMENFGGRATGKQKAPMELAQPATASKNRPQPKVLQEEREEEEEAERQDQERGGENGEDGGHVRNPMDQFKQIFPSWPISRYGRAHSHRQPVKLPPGVQKPEQLLMYSGPVKVESKVWLANQRTFVKWMHITVLLASLSLAIFNAAGETNKIAKGIACAYTLLSIFAGVWGWAIYMWRSKLIRERSGKEFDAVFGPLVVCAALAIALILNFVFKYREVVQREKDRQLQPVMTVDEIVDSARPLMGIIEQATGYAQGSSDEL